jgi:hypothetical protein
VDGSHDSYMTQEERKETREKGWKYAKMETTGLGRKEHLQLRARGWGVDLACGGGAELDPCESECNAFEPMKECVCIS